MNFLAHVFLSGTEIPLAVGNLVADRIKGAQYLNYEQNIQKGILLHRDIDSYTDAHPYFKQCASILFPKYRHYSRVIVDLFFDHCLAANWKDFHPEPLAQFSQNFYNALDHYRNIFPPDVEKLLYYLVINDWFCQYQTLSGLDAIMKQMAKRTRFPSGMERAVQDLELHYHELQENFFIFMPDLIRFTKDAIQKHEKND